MNTPKDTNLLDSNREADFKTVRPKVFNIGLIAGLLILGFAALWASNAISTASAKTEDLSTKEEPSATNDPNAPSSVSETPSPQASASPTPSRVPMTAEIIVASPRGFEPNLIRRRAGRMLLVIVNETGLPMMNLRTQRADGALLGVLEMPGRKRRLEVPMTLTTGRIRISDQSDPRRVLNIEVLE